MGNALKRSESRYRAEIIENNTRQQIEVCTPEFFAARRGVARRIAPPCSSSDCRARVRPCSSRSWPRTPRSKARRSLRRVQQIVSTLRGRDPDLNNPLYPRILTQMEPQEFLQRGEEYLAATRIYRTGKPFFIDKMPNNFRHLGLIHLMLPNARIIDARREPMACCFSNLKQLFCQWTGVHLQHRGYRALLPDLCRTDAALGPRAAGAGSARPSRGCRR